MFRFPSFLISQDLSLQLGTPLGHCSPIALAGLSAPWKNLATDSGSDGFEGPRCFQCPLGARFYKLHLLFPAKPYPNFFLLHIIEESKAIHCWNLETEKWPSMNTSSRAEKQRQS